MPTAAEREVIRRSPIALRIRGGKNLDRSRLGRVAGFFSEEKDDLVFRSSLGHGHTLTEHLKWMGGLLAHEASEFKRSKEDGFEVILEIQSEAADFEIEPEALLLPHKLQLRVEVRFRK